MRRRAHLSAWRRRLRVPGKIRSAGLPGLALGAMAALLMGGGGIALAVARDTAEPGPRQGGALLINQRSITPAGTQSALGDLPVNAALSPDGAHLLVVNSGAGIQSVQVVETKTGKVAQTIPYPVPNSAFVGAAYSPDGSKAYGRTTRFPTAS